MTRYSRSNVLAATLIGCMFTASQRAAAFDLNGAWALKADQCSKVFTRKGRANQVGFTNLSGAFGGGFIAEPDRLRSKFDTCSVKAHKEDGQDINLVVACSKGLMFTTVQFFLKVIDDQTIMRSFPGIEGMDITYHRCEI